MNTPIKEHPTIEAHRRKLAPEKISEPLDADWLRRLCLDAGADDVGFVEVDRPALAGELPRASEISPGVRLTLPPSTPASLAVGRDAFLSPKAGGNQAQERQL